MAASLVGDLLVLVLIAGALITVATWRRTSGGFATSMTFYIVLAMVIVALRVVFRALFGGASSGTVLFELPELRLPGWAAGIRLGGPVVWEDIVWSVTDASRLAAIILAVGAAMTLSDPRTALRSVPAALHDISVAVVITLTVLPQIISSAVRINRGRRLRGRPSKGLRAVVGTVVPVLEDAVEGSMTLATSMEVRGYGRTRNASKVGLPTTIALFAAILALTMGTYVLLGMAPGTQRWWGLPPSTWAAIVLLGGGAVVGITALGRSGKRLAVTHYRPAPWGSVENQLLVLSLMIVAMTLLLTTLFPPGTTATLVAIPGLVLLAGWVGRPR